MDDLIKDRTAIERARAAREVIEQIAAALGCPVSAFYDTEGFPHALSQSRELLSLWNSLRSEASRQALLDLVRSVVEAKHD